MVYLAFLFLTVLGIVVAALVLEGMLRGMQAAWLSLKALGSALRKVRPGLTR